MFGEGSEGRCDVWIWGWADFPRLEGEIPRQLSAEEIPGNPYCFAIYLFIILRKDQLAAVRVSNVPAIHT